MRKISYLYKKFYEHKREMGTWKTLRWLVFAIKFRVLSCITRGKINIRGEGNIRRKIKDARLIKKEGRRVFIFATVPYYDIGGGQRSAQLAKTFNLLGYEVYYIFGADSSESRIYNMEIPTVRHLHIDVYRLEDFEETLKKDDMVILEFPDERFLPFVELAKTKKAKIVYENIDNWETSLGNGRFKKAVLEKILFMSDLLVGTARPLIKQLKEYMKEFDLNKEIIYAPNAVDDALFDPKKTYKKPKDFVSGEKTFVYYGSLWGEWFDWNLVFGVAKKNPNYSFLLIGEEKCVQERVDKSPKNVHFLGIKRQSDLPAYLEFADYAMIPFVVDKIGEYVSPLKFFEYIAMNKVVLSTSLPEVKGYPNVLVGDDVESWCRLIEEGTKADRAKRNDFIIKNTWYSRGLNIVEALYKKNIEQCDKVFYKNITIVVLNYNNRNCIFDCIDSLLAFRHRYMYSIVVVDNNSSDGTYEEIKEKYGKKIKLLRNKRNGCSSGRNLGASIAKTDYIMFLDSDQFALNDYWLDNFASLMKKDKFGAVGWSGGWLVTPKRGWSSIVEDYPYRYMPADLWARVDLDYLATDGIIMKKEIFDKIGGFDEIFDPTCYEDTDLAFAIKNLGFDLAYCPYLGVYHLPHQTTKSGHINHDKMLEDHRAKFFAKWRKKNPELLKSN